MPPRRLRAPTSAWTLLVLLAGCAAPPPPTGLTDLVARPAEQALWTGWRAYDDGEYAQAEKSLRESLALGLAAPRDRAQAHKLLAFVLCSRRQLDDCEQAFRAARAADPAFDLARSEAGHPLWGPVWRRVAGR
ncbi:TssQ family T6SS-associated lipoprotein [Aquabacterium sp. J223]|uniref:TssQ family T6SS-associated lipoprotein n=1 Tax=Aquabacterium sp. J223 TaxID=2898431 RepID=UPI0021ADBCD6|nr:TssQ family T6SS-associated lipoprotein [Aquabacterium sp. J223]UUX94612.1 TssQ family T6SS-associated lipoprotein [Aquabacterium sp. J223]